MLTGTKSLLLVRATLIATVAAAIFTMTMRGSVGHTKETSTIVVASPALPMPTPGRRPSPGSGQSGSTKKSTGPVTPNGPPTQTNNKLPGPVSELQLNPPTALANDFAITSLVFQENTAKVIPPGAGCAKGSITLSTGQPRASAVLLNRPLLDRNDNLDTLSSSTQSKPFPISSTSALGTDNQIIRLKDGSLLATRDSYVWDNFTTNAPPWFGEKVSGSGNCASAADLTKCQHQRGAILVFRSTNCGASWSLLSTIDSGKLNQGKYGYPRPIGDKTGPCNSAGNCDCKTAANCDSDPKIDFDGDGDDDVDVTPANQAAYPDGSLKWWVGGFDRTEIYACPFTGNLYLTSNIKRGPYKSTSYLTTALLLYSRDGGKTWTVLKDDLDAWPPIVMTSTPNGRLFLFQQVSRETYIRYSQPLSPRTIPVIGRAYEVHYEVRGQKRKAVDPTDVNAKIDLFLQGDHPSISRISTDTSSSVVRVAYHSMNLTGMQEASVISIEAFDDSQPPVVKPIATIRAGDPKNFSVVYFNFIDPDYIDMPAGTKTNISLMYWIEAPRIGFAPTRKYAIGAAFLKDSLVSPSVYLSNKSGSSDPWFIATSQHSVGDYLNGGFFWRNNSLNYLAQWVEPSGIKANIVTLAMPPP